MSDTCEHGVNFYKDRCLICRPVDGIKTFSQFSGVELIAEERTRQISEEGWSSVHDDEHRNYELARAGAVYADAAGLVAAGALPEEVKQSILTYGCETPWPWEPEWLKINADPVRCLVKAGALIAAEIDRLNRLNSN